jgi:hypothetical protein
MENKKQIIDESTANLFKKLFAVDLLKESLTKNFMGYTEYHEEMNAANYEPGDYFKDIDYGIYISDGDKWVDEEGNPINWPSRGSKDLGYY